MAMPRAALLFAMALALGTSRAARPSEAMEQLCNEAQTELVKCGSDFQSADPGTCCSLLEEYHKNGCFCPDCERFSPGLVSEAGVEALYALQPLVQACRSVGDSSDQVMDMLTLKGLDEERPGQGANADAAEGELAEDKSGKALGDVLIGTLLSQSSPDVQTVDVRIRGSAREIKDVLGVLERAAVQDSGVVVRARGAGEGETAQAVEALLAAARLEGTHAAFHPGAERVCACQSPGSWPRNLPAPLQTARDALCRLACQHRQALKGALAIEALLALALALLWSSCTRDRDQEEDEAQEQFIFTSGGDERLA